MRRDSKCWPHATPKLFGWTFTSLSMDKSGHEAKLSVGRSWPSIDCCIRNYFYHIIFHIHCYSLSIWFTEFSNHDNVALYPTWTSARAHTHIPPPCTLIHTLAASDFGLLIFSFEVKIFIRTWWKLGSLIGLHLGFQIITGIFLADKII